MASSISYFLFVYIILCYFLNCFTMFGSKAQLIPLDEVKTLQTISEKLENKYWNVSQKSCSDGGKSFNRSFDTTDVFSKVTCDCSFNSNTVCHVTHIQLKGLNLTGFLPEEFGSLPHLQDIDLSRNYVYGTIPRSLSKIPLVNLSLLGNRNTGPIPSEIGQIATLEQLILEDNQLEGPLPKSLGNLKNLIRMVLTANFFNGTIPETFVNLKKLIDLRLTGNLISGKIPDFIGNFTDLTSLEIQGTTMEGPIPSTLSKLTKLNNLKISDINTKSIPFPNLALLENLQYLVLRNCSITGRIPNSIGNLSKLKLMDLSFNQLSGQIPESMESMQQLSYLILTNNSLSGTVPGWILNSRHNFDVSYNNFTGSPQASCQESNVNLVASYSSEKNNSLSWCLKKDLPCSKQPQYHSLFINCGGNVMSFKGNEYEGDTSPGSPSTFFASGEKWAYSTTGSFLYTDSANFLASKTSNPNLTGIYQTARLSPLFLKYYGLCLLRGSYNVKLHFAEIVFSNDKTFGNIGRRYFDVAIQGTVKLKDFNIEAAAQGAGKPVTRDFDVYVNGSTLEISLYWVGRGTTMSPHKGLYGPLISGITVTPNFKINRGLPTGAIAVIVLGSCTVICISILAVLWVRRLVGGKNQQDEELRKLSTGYFTLRQIKAATDDFDHRNKIGEGGFGSVFKGTLADGKVIAVKQLCSKSKQGNREFVNEIGMISALQHPNLVKLYGCCIEGKELLLVYEYMENNSLARALFDRENQKFHLNWQTRKSICLGIARGLAYLHEESSLKIVHRDIKATNVLLDKDMNAKISDFGLAKLNEDENTHISTRIAGTIGYMAPEYAMRGYLTDKADVYSFGVVVLEIVSGTSNTNCRPKEEFVYLLDWAYVLQEQGNLLELVDPTLGSNYSKEEALRLLDIALLCTNPSPSLRPSMSSVMSMINGHIPVQAPTVKRSGVNKNNELRFRAFERVSQDNITYASGSSMSSQVRRSLSTDGPWTDDVSISNQDNDESNEEFSSASRLISDDIDVNRNLIS